MSTHVTCGELPVRAPAIFAARRAPRPVGARATAASHPSLLSRAMAALMSMCGCEHGSAPSLAVALETIGVTDPAVPAPVAVDVLCDPSEGSTCQRGYLQTLLAHAVDAVSSHPGSVVRVTVMGATPGESQEIATLTVPAGSGGSIRAGQLARERFLTTAEQTVCPRLDSILARPRPRASHIVEALDEIALARPARLPLFVLALTDGREVSGLADFECRPLPTADAFRARLDARNLLVRNAFANASVTFVVADRGPVPRRRCGVSMGRERHVQDIWAGALRAAGAHDVRFAAGIPTVADLAVLYDGLSPDGGVR